MEKQENEIDRKGSLCRSGGNGAGAGGRGVCSAGETACGISCLRT